jgi:hypothetical protein
VDEKVVECYDVFGACGVGVGVGSLSEDGEDLGFAFIWRGLRRIISELRNGWRPRVNVMENK